MLLSAFVLLVLVSIDVFMVGFTYGLSKVRVSWKKVVLISLIGNVMLGGALVFGYLIRDYITDDIIKWTVFGLFMLIGFLKLINNQNSGVKSVGIKEAIVLGIILAIDGVGVGFAVGLDGVTMPFIFAIITLSFAVDILFFKIGQHMGGRLTKKTKFNLWWLNGVMFMLIGIVGLFL